MHYCNITLVNSKCSSIVQTPIIFKVSSICTKCESQYYRMFCYSGYLDFYVLRVSFCRKITDCYVVFWHVYIETQVLYSYSLFLWEDYFSNILNISQRIDTYLCKLPDQGFTREVLKLQTHCMYPEMEQKNYQSLKDIEDISGLKLLWTMFLRTFRSLSTSSLIVTSAFVGCLPHSCVGEIEDWKRSHQFVQSAKANIIVCSLFKHFFFR
jgi:hypothetical protein